MLECVGMLLLGDSDTPPQQQDARRWVELGLVETLADFVGTLQCSRYNRAILLLECYMLACSSRSHTITYHTPWIAICSTPPAQQTRAMYPLLPLNHCQ